MGFTFTIKTFADNLGQLIQYLIEQARWASGRL